MEVFYRSKEEVEELFKENKLFEELLAYIHFCFPQENSGNCLQVAKCFKSMLGELFGICRCGDFCKAVLDDSIINAVRYADNLNRKNLYMYAFLLMNCVPSGVISSYRLKKVS